MSAMRRALATAAGAGAVVHTLPALAPLVPGLCDGLGIRRRLEGVNGVALTFDDGPHAEGTPATLELLGQRGATATFFLAGEQVERRPALAREIVDAGHAVALHCHRHRVMLRLTPRQIRDDLERGAFAIAEATGQMPAIERPPLGIFSPWALSIVRHGGWEPVLWSQWGRDWNARATAQSICSKLTGKVRAGDILLLHDSDAYSASDSWRDTVAALPAILDRLAERQLPTVSLV